MHTYTNLIKPVVAAIALVMFAIPIIAWLLFAENSEWRFEQRIAPCFNHNDEWLNAVGIIIGSGLLMWSLLLFVWITLL